MMLKLVEQSEHRNDCRLVSVDCNYKTHPVVLMTRGSNTGDVGLMHYIYSAQRAASHPTRGFRRGPRHVDCVRCSRRYRLDYCNSILYINILIFGISNEHAAGPTSAEFIHAYNVVRAHNNNYADTRRTSLAANTAPYGVAYRLTVLRKQTQLYFSELIRLNKPSTCSAIVTNVGMQYE